MDLEFEWDEEKNKLNKKKHGISFETAQMVFQDPYRIEFFDDENSKKMSRDMMSLVWSMICCLLYIRKE